MKVFSKTKQKGPSTGKWLNKLSRKDHLKELDKYARQGVEALASATPVRTGLTAASWTYTIEHSSSQTSIYWMNTNVTHQGQPIAILLQYGHGTGTGGYVMGQDYINPAMKSVFDDIADGVWKVVTSNE